MLLYPLQITAQIIHLCNVLFFHQQHYSTFKQSSGKMNELHLVDFAPTRLHILYPKLSANLYNKGKPNQIWVVLFFHVPFPGSTSLMHTNQLVRTANILGLKKA